MGDDNADTLYADLPDDPEEAFLILERLFRVECDRAISAISIAGQNENTNDCYEDYLVQVLGAIAELGLTPEFDRPVPQIANVDYETYKNLRKDIKRYCTMLEIRHGRRLQRHSIRFNSATKEKVRHHVKQLRTIFDHLEVDEKKREALFDKLNELEQEVDRNRTRIDSLAALTIEVSDVLGEAVEKTKVLDILDHIAKVFWGAKSTDENRRLPPPPRQKRLEPPEGRLDRMWTMKSRSRPPRCRWKPQDQRALRKNAGPRPPQVSWGASWRASEGDWGRSRAPLEALSRLLGHSRGMLFGLTRHENKFLLPTLLAPLRLRY
jgi:hypothetical protein